MPKLSTRRSERLQKKLSWICKHTLMSNQDTPYWINAFLEEASKKVECKIFEREIAVNGYLLVKSGPHTAKIYKAELALVLTSHALTGEHRDLKNPIELNSQEYLKTYIEAFTEGEGFFEDNFKASPEVLYGANQKQYIQDLHNNYFHIQHHPGKEGWNCVRHQHPFILTHEEVKTFGYYSGLVSKVDELVERHPQLFANFNKGNGDDYPRNAEINRTDLRQKIEKHFEFFSGPCPRKHKTILSDDDFKKLIDWTVSYYSNDLQLPHISQPIRTVNTNKTYVQLAFRYLFKELYPGTTFPPSLFDFYRSAFLPYSAERRENFQRVKHNGDVKKLMRID
jgi:hypothetical protein